MKKLPSKWILEGETYEVKVVEKLQDPETGKRIGGLYDPDNCRICIEKLQTVEAQWKVLFHESMHFFYNERIHNTVGAVAIQIFTENRDDELEENICKQFGPFLLDLLKENKLIK